MRIRTCIGLLIASACFVWVSGEAGSGDEREIVATLDREFQAAVKVNDVQTMERILHKDMILVLGNGTTNTRDELLR